MEKNNNEEYKGIYKSFNKDNNGLDVLKRNNWTVTGEKDSSVYLESQGVKGVWDLNKKSFKLDSKFGTTFKRSGTFDTAELSVQLEHGGVSSDFFHKNKGSDYVDEKGDAKPWKSILGTYHLDDKIIESLDKSTKIDLFNKPEEPKPLLSLYGSSVFDVGNQSAIVSRSGEGKSALGNLLGAELIANKTKGFQSYLGAGKILIFETEQTGLDAYNRLNTIAIITGLSKKEIQDLVEVVYLTECPDRAVRKKYIVNRIMKSKGVRFVILDGVADALDSINDETPAKNLVEDLSQIALMKKLHILSIIHSSDKSQSLEAAGWLGSLWKKKIQTELNVSTRNNQFVISFSKFRAAAKPSNIYFDRLNKGIPQFCQDAKKGEEEKLIGLYDSDEYMKKIFTTLMEKGSYVNAKDLARGVVDLMKRDSGVAPKIRDVINDVANRFIGTLIEKKSRNAKFNIIKL